MVTTLRSRISVAKETIGDQKTGKRGCLKQIRFRHPVSSPKDGLQPGNLKCKTVTEEK
jgi:hypothetical protein